MLLLNNHITLNSLLVREILSKVTVKLNRLPNHNSEVSQYSTFTLEMSNLGFIIFTIIAVAKKCNSFE